VAVKAAFKATELARRLRSDLASGDARRSFGVRRVRLGREVEAEVRKAYRQLCLNWHPDKHASSTEDQRERARHRFCRIQAAYEKLQAAAKASSSPFSGFESAYSGYAMRTSA
jgi:DnaJ-domain-containing protein 1